MNNSSSEDWAGAATFAPHPGTALSGGRLISPCQAATSPADAVAGDYKLPPAIAAPHTYQNPCAIPNGRFSIFGMRLYPKPFLLSFEHDGFHSTKRVRFGAWQLCD
jgi:hypothetical protein